MSEIDEIRKRHKEGDRANAVEDRCCLLDWVKRLRVDLEIERMRLKEHQAEVERLRYVLRDTAEDLESDDPTPHKLLAGIIRKALEGAP